MIRLPKPELYKDLETWAEKLVATLEAKFARELAVGSLTVAELPPPDEVSLGARYFVVDADDTTFHSVVNGGGTDKVPVFSDGADWRIG